MPLAHCSYEARPYTARYSSYMMMKMMLSFQFSPHPSSTLLPTKTVATLQSALLPFQSGFSKVACIISLKKSASMDIIMLSYIVFNIPLLVGPIPWGHRGLLCHTFSLSLSSLSWTSMRRRRATVPLATPGECAVRRLAVANGPNIFQMLLVYLSDCL